MWADRLAEALADWPDVRVVGFRKAKSELEDLKSEMQSARKGDEK
jgi:hypothetical protein